VPGSRKNFRSKTSREARGSTSSGRFRELAAALAETGRSFYARGWVFGTSGNFSAVTSERPLRLAITPTGLDKGALEPAQFLEIDENARVVLSEAHSASGAVAIEGFEMLKGLEGVSTHEHREILPIFENSQDIAALAAQVQARLKSEPSIHGFLLRRHGLYTWGRDVVEAKRHVEILEFLLEAVGRSGSGV
jgi:methylthioribulose-1-phosphate dehydratase